MVECEREVCVYMTIGGREFELQREMANLEKGSVKSAGGVEISFRVDCTSEIRTLVKYAISSFPISRYTTFLGI